MKTETKKRLAAAAMALALLLGSAAPSRAAEETGQVPEVIFDGTQEIRYENYDSSANFGTKFQNMLPSEERVQEILLKNESERTVDFFMDTEILESLQQVADDASYHVKLEVVRGSESTVIFGAGAQAVTVGGTSGEGRAVQDGNQGLKELNDTLSGYRMVTTLGRGEEAVVRLSITLDGETGSNSYQAQTGQIQFRFQVGYNEPEVVNQVVNRPNPPQVQTVTEQRTVYRDSVTGEIVSPEEAQRMMVTGNNRTSVNTGDQTPVIPLMAMAGGAALVIVLLLIKKKKEEKQEG
ncbi:MAG: LPXTG cell wall anchor domain-containing protein [Lachnospiraceae bacterium]|jgi:LPXTG-motif cell wall-anchored protein|nr:LPXTG cell wall anchor domain-containing protein [Lachnospiraceae bacterium]